MRSGCLPRRPSGKFIVDLLAITGGDAALVAEIVGMTADAVLDYWPASGSGVDRTNPTVRSGVDAALDRLDSKQVPGQTGIPLTEEDGRGGLAG